MSVYTYKPKFGVAEFVLSSSDENIGIYETELSTLRFPEKTMVDVEQWPSISCYLRVVDSDTGEELIESDMPSNCDGLMIFTKKAKDALDSFVKPYGQFLPLNCDKKELYILNVYNVVDCLNWDESSIFWEGEKSKTTPFIEDYCFDIEKLEGQSMFRLPYKNETRTYFTEKFIDTLKKLGIEGFNYRLISR
ncbi:DUF1629 domain-containing protein [Vibrio cholerae]